MAFYSETPLENVIRFQLPAPYNSPDAIKLTQTSSTGTYFIRAWGLLTKINYVRFNKIIN